MVASVSRWRFCRPQILDLTTSKPKRKYVDEKAPNKLQDADWSETTKTPLKLDEKRPLRARPKYEY